MKLMELTITFTAKSRLMNDDDVTEVTNDLENLFIKDKLQNVLQNLIDDHDLSAHVAVTVED